MPLCRFACCSQDDGQGLVCSDEPAKAGQGGAGQGRAGQGRAGQGGAGQGGAGLGWGSSGLWLKTEAGLELKMKLSLRLSWAWCQYTKGSSTRAPKHIDFLKY